MRSKLWFPLFLFSIYWSSSVSYADFAARMVDIDDFMAKSDLVAIGSVAKKTSVYSNDSRDQSQYYLGKYCRIRVDKVLYAESEIAEAIFAANDLKHINVDLKRHAPKHIFVFGMPLHIIKWGPKKNSIAGSISDVAYIRDTEYLFFFKISKFPEQFPNSYLYDPGRTPVASLDQPFFFEAAIPTRDSTRNLKFHREVEWLPYVETLSEALSIPDQARKEERLRELSRDKDPILAQNAQNALLRVSPTERARRRARMNAEWLLYYETVLEALSIPSQARRKERLRELAHDKNRAIARLAKDALLCVSPTEIVRKRTQMIEIARTLRANAAQK